MARRLLALCSIAVLIFGCSPAPTPAPTVASTPGPVPTTSTSAPASQGPSASQTRIADGTSSQALIAADLAAGSITMPQSLLYRAWAAFGDPGLPERYDGTGSAFEDPTLIDEIGQLLPSLDTAERAALEPFTLRPSNPRSYWSGGASATAAAGAGLTNVVPANASNPPLQKCTAPRSWQWDEWSAGPSDDEGFRFWACDYSKEAAQPTFDELIATGSKLWGAMTKPEPLGMGLPIPDTGVPQADGNGKIDVYVVDPAAECKQRGNDCVPVSNFDGVSPTDSPKHCGVNSAPAKACTSYMILDRLKVYDSKLPQDFAHEFFHVLQASHNATLGDFWYVEASATWAEWQYVATSGLFPRASQASREEVVGRMTGYLSRVRSLLRHVWATDDGYLDVVWPMFQSIEGGPEIIFKTWQALEPASSTASVDGTIDRVFPFAEHLRDFTAWTAQPNEYKFGTSTGLDPDRWQTKPNLAPPDGFPLYSRRFDWVGLKVELLRQTIQVDIEDADASNSTFTSIDPKVRQIVIDASGLSNAGNLDVELLAKMRPQGEDPTDTWRRIPARGVQLVLCRDHPTEDVELFELIVTNHAHTRASNGTDPDPVMQAKGDVVITGKDSCDAPAGFTGTFSGTNTIDSWSGTAVFQRVQPGTNAAACEDQGGVYCYDLVGGSVTWTVQGRTKTVSLAPPDAAGEVVLIFSDPAHPNHNGTYELSASPSVDISIALKNGDRQAFDTVRAWMNAIKFPKFPSDFHLRGTEDSGSGCGIDGCGPTTVWNWNLTATYN